MVEQLSLALQTRDTMTSRQISEITGKAHKDVLRAIRGLKSSSKAFDFAVSFYINKQGKQIPEYIMETNNAMMMVDKVSGMLRIPMQLQEKAAIATIEQLLSVSLVRQFRVGPYRIDGYDKENNVAYEIDESAHRYSAANDGKRQGYIEREIGCKFVRIRL